MQRIIPILGIILILISSGIPTTLSFDGYKINKIQNNEDIDWWIMAKHDSTHNAFSKSLAPDTNEIIWLSELDIDRPVVYQYKLYGISDDRLFCLNATTGEELWRTQPIYLNSEFSYPCIYNGTIFIGSLPDYYNTTIWCLDSEDGRQLWNLSINGLEGILTIHKGKLFLHSESNLSNILLCFNASDGTKNWEYNTNEDIRNSPSISNEKVCLGTRKNIICLNEENGEELWSFNHSGSRPIIHNNKVYFGTNYVYCLDIENGEVIWYSEVVANDFNVSDIVIAYDKVFVSCYNSFYWGILYCFEEETGNTLWNKTIDGRPSDLIVADNKLFFSNFHANAIYCLNTVDGKKIWSYDCFGDFGLGSIIIADGKIYFGSYKLYCFGYGPPNCSIELPENYIFFKGVKIKNPFFNGTIIIGGIEVFVNASDYMGVDRVEFYVDDEYKFTDNIEPFVFSWNESLFGRYILKAVAYDTIGNIGYDEIKVWKFF